MSAKRRRADRLDRLHLASGEEVEIRYLLDSGTRALARDLHRLDRARLEEQADHFIAALWADQILPEDF